MKVLILIALMLTVSSCGKAKRWASGMTGDAYETCHRGVTYLQFTSGSTIALDRDGKPLS